MLVTHISRLDFNLAFDRAAGTVKLCLASAPELLMGTARFIEKVDELFNDAAVDFAIAIPSMLGACLAVPGGRRM
eukprot:4210554-Pleurochrysis_carterae.AAC.1